MYHDHNNEKKKKKKIDLLWTWSLRKSAFKKKEVLFLKQVLQISC